MIEYRIDLLGDPVPKARQRVNFSQKRTYPNPKTAKYEAMIRIAFDDKYPNADPLVGAVGIVVRFFYAVPASWSKKKREKALRGEIPMTKKPDLDNLLKSVLDSLNKVAWLDDKQITSSYTEKAYAEQSKLSIYIYGKEEEDE